MISDFVKGKQQFMFSGEVQQGIRLHRAIDEFTDNHPATRKAMEIFRPVYRLYSGAIMDVLYDHFLATDTDIFTTESLRSLTQATYDHLDQYDSILPPRFRMFFTYMKAEDWLFNYRHTSGMEKSLRGLARRAAYMPDSAAAFDLFLEQYDFLRDCYSDFIKDVKIMAKQNLINLD
jgi:acyl carrier protein phosphodiesterase